MQRSLWGALLQAVDLAGETHFGMKFTDFVCFPGVKSPVGAAEGSHSSKNSLPAGCFPPAMSAIAVAPSPLRHRSDTALPAIFSASLRLCANLLYVFHPLKTAKNLHDLRKLLFLIHFPSVFSVTCGSFLFLGYFFRNLAPEAFPQQC
jgi:hypothetical protein